MIVKLTNTTSSKRKTSKIDWFLAMMIVLTVCSVGLSHFINFNDNPSSSLDFELITFNGEQVSLSDFRGDIVVLHFWASWCAPCRIEAPEFQATWELYEQRGDIHFIGLAYRDQVAESRAFIEEFGITYINAPDLGHEIANMFALQGIPSTFIINRHGEAVTYLYARIDRDVLITEIEDLLSN